jgi:methylenetetrahydrofolate dehydrogenase (NADP+)/methenyltetrahydrofolate cyclohydrolase
MQIIDGLALSQEHQSKIKISIQQKKIRPSLCVIIVGSHPASLLYVANKKKACENVGILYKVLHFQENSSTQEIIETIQEANKNPMIHGIFVQLPLPTHLDKDMIIESIHPQKDVDGLHSKNVGLLWSGRPCMIPCTPLGCVQLIETVHPSIEGKDIVIVGRSQLVGKPLAALLLMKNATVTMTHSYTKNLQDYCLKADIVIAAIGKPHFIKQVKKGCTVIDVGITKTESGIKGDVDPGVEAGYITPVPGGVGPMTIVNLLWNTYKASCILSESETRV